jgi:hypothetical protein
VGRIGEPLVHGIGTLVCNFTRTDLGEVDSPNARLIRGSR